MSVFHNVPGCSAREKNGTLERLRRGIVTLVPLTLPASTLFRLPDFRTLLTLKNILPHHALNGACAGHVVFGIVLGIIKRFDLAFHHKVNELADGHAGINLYRLGAADLERPGIAEAYIALAGGGVYVDAQPPRA